MRRKKKEKKKGGLKSELHTLVLFMIQKLTSKKGEFWDGNLRSFLGAITLQKPDTLAHLR